MPSLFLMQPNGKLARFSTIVDNFTDANLTEEKAYEVAHLDMGVADARAKVARGLLRTLDAEGGWNECLETIRVVHGAETCDAVVAEILGGESEAAPSSAAVTLLQRLDDAIPRRRSP